mmetsp:Transcript_7809/g.28854  ORF Transcript_7809/g.28854 Transcript_7809/m.28854 type:complete len:156 (-) Transcript_7809:1035-1502(-)
MGVSKSSSEVSRIPSIIIGQLDGGSILDQDCRNTALAIECRPEYRGHSVGTSAIGEIRRIRRCYLIVSRGVKTQQSISGIYMSTAASPMNRGVTIQVAQRWISTTPQQQGHYSRVPIATSPVERCVAFLGCGMDICPGFQSWNAIFTPVFVDAKQ